MRPNSPTQAVAPPIRIQLLILLLAARIKIGITLRRTLPVLALLTHPNKGPRTRSPSQGCFGRTPAISILKI